MYPYPLKKIVKNGNERFFLKERSLDFSLLDFWRWSSSDIVSNSMRGVLAEFIIAKALDIDMSIPRNEWQEYDLITSDGIKIEVKSAAYIQSWAQTRYSNISFSIKKAFGWNEETNLFETEKRRHADVYVFALLHHKDKETIDPMDLDQWCFYILSTKELDNYQRSSHSITLPSLERISGGSVPYDLIRSQVELKAKENHEIGSDMSVRIDQPSNKDPPPI